MLRSPSDGTQSKAAPVSGEASAEVLGASMQQQQHVDPFRIGYNMGMQNVHLEALRSKLDDNLELFKSHFYSLLETTKSNHEAVRRALSDSTKQSSVQLDDTLQKVGARIDTLERRFQASEEQMRALNTQKVEALQRHVDDRLENIKDTIKLVGIVLSFISLWALFLLNQMYHRSTMPLPAVDVPVSSASLRGKKAEIAREVDHLATK